MSKKIWSTEEIERHLIDIAELETEEQSNEVYEALCEELIPQGVVIAPALLAILNNKTLQFVDTPGKGKVPIYAAQLLGELKYLETATPMLACLEKLDNLSILHETIIFSLISFGEPLLPILLMSYEASSDPTFCRTLSEILISLKIRDERIYEICLNQLEREPDWGASLLSRYGDERALPHLQRVLDILNIYKPKLEQSSWLSIQDIVELCEAIKILGGRLTSSQQRKLDEVTFIRGATHIDISSFIQQEQKKSERDSGRNNPSKKVKLGRNAPCWCGSGNKYKRCHLNKDQAP